MDFETQPHIVYIKSDDQNRIQAVDSSAFLTDANGWIEIDSGFETKHHHAQGNYFPKPVYDERGICRYKVVPFVDWPEGKIIQEFFYEGEEYGVFERTQAEMDADWVEPVPQPDPTERIKALEEQLAAAKILLGVE